MNLLQEKSIANDARAEAVGPAGALPLADNRPQSALQQKPMKTSSAGPLQLKDNRPQAVLKEKQVNALATRSTGKQPVQKRANNTGLPDELKSGIEQLSGQSMDDVKVHYNSSQPAQLNAHAYAQGTDIHIASGQEKHLPHEAWHTVQQKQGRVRSTSQLKGKVNINDDQHLEKEADVMGSRALQFRRSAPEREVKSPETSLSGNLSAHGTYQRVVFSWLKKSLVSVANLAIGAPFRVPLRIVDLAKHLTVDLIRAIYHAYRRPTIAGPVGLMSEQSITANWLAGVVTRFGDIFQLRELIGSLTTILATPLSQVRGLSSAEKQLATEIFGSSINLTDVTILENSAITKYTAGSGGAFTVAHTIHTDEPLTNASPAIEEEKQAMLMHELMHIAQEQKLGILSWIELEWGRRRTTRSPTAPAPGETIDSDYNYGVIGPASVFRGYSREQQGAIVQDYAKYLKHKPALARAPADPIVGEYGSGTYQHYQAMLHGLSLGHWALPVRRPAWNSTIG